MNIRKLHLPSLGILGVLIGGLLRALAFALQWPLPIVLLSEIVLLMAVAWIIMFDFFPIFLYPFYVIRQRFLKRTSFFVGLLGFFAIMQLITYFLPSGHVKDMTTTLAFLSFISAMLWGVGAYIAVTFTPLVAYLRYKPRQAERVTFADIITSMAIIITPTIALSFFFTPAGLGRVLVTPYQVFLTGLLTNIFMAAYLYLFVIRPHVFTWKQLGLRRVDREDIGRSLVLFIFISVVIFIIQALLKRVGISISQYSFGNKDGALLAYLGALIITPFVEELYFRGFLFKGLLMHNKPWLAFIISSLIFAVLHPPLLVMVETFVIGLLLAYTVRESKSIWPAVLIHALNNAIVFAYLLYK